MPITITPPTQTTVVNYTYDPLYRLTGANATGAYTGTFAYTYDAVGNRLTQTTNGALTNYAYDAANRLTSVNGVAYTWDNNGNLRNDGARTFTYNQANRLKTAAQGTNNYVYTYNGVGDRVRQTANGVTTNYALDLNAGLTQVLADGSSAYLYGNGRIAQYQTAMQYFGADALGSVRQIYNASGQVVANNRYDPYGNVLAQSGAASAYGFTGEMLDATGLVYLRARFYDGAQGRFTTRDTWPGDYQRPLSLNAWSYVEGNPINRQDPSGTFSISLINQSLHNKSLQEVFGKTQYGFARWGLYHLLKDANDGDVISPLTVASEIRRTIPDNGSRYAYRTDTRSLPMVKNPLYLSAMGSYKVRSNGCELIFTSEEATSWESLYGPYSLSEFVDRIREVGFLQAGEGVPWRLSTYANHWYARNNDTYYDDFGGKTEMPDFMGISVGVPIKGPLGASVAGLIDRYGNKYLAWFKLA